MKSVRLGEQTVDLDELLARVLAPRRPHYEQAKDAAKDLTDTSEAWELLASREVIPMSWIESSSRWFTAEEPPAQLAVTGNQNPTHEQLVKYMDEGPLVTTTPPTIDACITLASDPQGVVTAEALALETMRCLEPWGCPQPSVVAWRTINPKTWKTLGTDWRHAPCAHVAYQSAHEKGYREKDPYAAKFDFGTPEWRAAYSVDCMLAWLEAVKRGGVVAAHHRAEITTMGQPQIPETLLRKKLSNLPNPFEPLLALWNTGYGFDAITATAVVLVAPMAVDAPVEKPKKTTRKK